MLEENYEYLECCKLVIEWAACEQPVSESNPFVQRKSEISFLTIKSGKLGCNLIFSVTNG